MTVNVRARKRKGSTPVKRVVKRKPVVRTDWDDEDMSDYVPVSYTRGSDTPPAWVVISGMVCVVAVIMELVGG